MPLRKLPAARLKSGIPLKKGGLIFLPHRARVAPKMLYWIVDESGLSQRVDVQRLFEGRFAAMVGCALVLACFFDIGVFFQRIRQRYSTSQ